MWTQDEARLGLKPVTRRAWAPKGERPTAHARPAYEWLWLFAAVHPASGRVFWLVLPYLNAQMMERFLDAFAREHSPRASASSWCSTARGRTARGVSECRSASRW